MLALIDMRIANIIKKLFPQRRSPSKQRTTRQQTGDLGEQLAAKYLRKHKRYKVLDTNWRDGKYELDLVCLDRDMLVFVEVKTRAIHSPVSGYFAVNNKKKQALRKAISRYRKAQLNPIHHYRFDIVEVELGNSIAETKINHYDRVPLGKR